MIKHLSKLITMLLNTERQWTRLNTVWNRVNHLLSNDVVKPDYRNTSVTAIAASCCTLPKMHVLHQYLSQCRGAVEAVCWTECNITILSGFVSLLCAGRVWLWQTWKKPRRLQLKLQIQRRATSSLSAPSLLSRLLKEVSQTILSNDFILLSQICWYLH